MLYNHLIRSWWAYSKKPIEGTLAFIGTGNVAGKSGAMNIKFFQGPYVSGNIYYSTDKLNWTQLPSSGVNMNTNSTLYFVGNIQSTGLISSIGQFDLDDKIYFQVQGDPTSLAYGLNDVPTDNFKKLLTVRK